MFAIYYPEIKLYERRATKGCYNQQPRILVERVMEASLFKDRASAYRRAGKPRIIGKKSINKVPSRLLGIDFWGFDKKLPIDNCYKGEVIIVEV